MKRRSWIDSYSEKMNNLLGDLHSAYRSTSVACTGNLERKHCFRKRGGSGDGGSLLISELDRFCTDATITLSETENEIDKLIKKCETELGKPLRKKKSRIPLKITISSICCMLHTIVRDREACLNQVLYGFMCAEHSAELLGVQLVNTHNMGNGLFATKLLKEGICIDWYAGEQFSASSYSNFTTRISEAIRHRSSGPGEMYTKDYGVSLSEEKVLLPLLSTASFAMYANHTDIGYNAHLVVTEKEEVLLVSLRDIEPGEQIMISYGNKYWTEL